MGSDVGAFPFLLSELFDMLSLLPPKLVCLLVSVTADVEASPLRTKGPASLSSSLVTHKEVPPVVLALLALFL